MRRRGNHFHYEWAFQAYVRSLRVHCAALHEHDRCQDPNRNTIKTFDFLVLPGARKKLLVDVKGRQLTDKYTTLQSWATDDDLASLSRWEQVFGANAISLLVFTYHIATVEKQVQFENVFEYQDRRYGFLAVRVADFVRHKRKRSAAWQTVDVPTSRFRELGKPFTHWLADAA